MRLGLSRWHFPVTTLGIGRRLGVWFQGCTLRCPGCVSVDTWERNGGETTVSAVMEQLTPWVTEADGLTVSGGEPLQQSEALEELLRHWTAAKRPNADTLLYTGYSWEEAELMIEPLRQLLDVVISDPYEAKAGQTLLWRGSDNQRMHLLSPLGHARYAQWQMAPRTALPQAMDIFFQGNEVWLAGIPEPGMMPEIHRQLGRAGYASTHSQSPLIHQPSPQRS